MRGEDREQLDRVVGIVRDVLGAEVVGAYLFGSAVLAPLLTMALLADTPLLGPPPADVLDPVPHEDLLEATAGNLDAIVAGLDVDDTRNVILTLARIWSTTATGAIRSKDAAADWALERLPEEHRPVLARARAIYLGDEEERWDDLRPRLQPHVEYVVEEIRRCRRAAAEGFSEG